MEIDSDSSISDSSSLDIKSISSEEKEEFDEYSLKQQSHKNEVPFYESAEDLLTFATNHKKIKILLESSPINPNYYLKDISLHKKGPIEDKLYAKHPIFYYNIRRGNTILEIYDPPNQTPNRILCRKGLTKFYDISTELLEYTKNLNQNEKIVPFMTSIQKKIRNIIFRNIERLLLNSETKWDSLEICKLYKENGEHCQIGYIKQVDSWIIASKNVTILLQNRENLSQYIKKRHYWPKIIAEQWFEYLQTLSTSQISELKTALNGLTLLGEHCGHPKHTHIIHYPKIEIIFYAIVENLNQKAPCLAPNLSFDFFDKFGLKKSKMDIIKGCKNYNDFLEKMDALLNEIELSTCEKEGEGSVVYVTYNNEVLSMCKMKTIEYLIFRSLREHLKKQVNKANIQRHLKFNKEVNMLYVGKKLLRSKEYYLELGKKAFEYIENKDNKVTFEEVYYNFVDLLKLISNGLSKFVPKDIFIEDFQLILITPPLILGENTNEILKKALEIDEVGPTWREEMPLKPGLTLYNLHLTPKLSGKMLDHTFFLIGGFSEKSLKKSLESLKEIEKSGGAVQKYPGLVSYLTKKDQKSRNQMLENLVNKISSFMKTLQDSKYPHIYLQNEIIIADEFIDKIKSILPSNQKKKNVNESESKELYVLLPFGVPGMGKTFLLNVMQKIMKDKDSNVRFYYVSIDNVRHEIQEKIAEHSAESSDMYSKTVKETSKRFYSLLNETMNEILIQICRKCILFIDKNYTQSVLQKTLEIFHKNLKNSDREIKIFGLIQNSPSKIFRIKEYNYPFSSEFILICLARCLNRESHETMDQDPIYRVKVFLKFVQIFRNIKLKKLNGIDFFMDIPFVIEEQLEKDENYEKLIELITQGLELIDPKYEPKDSPIFLKIVEEYYRIFKMAPKEISEEEYKFKIKKIIDSYIFNQS